MEHIIRIIKGMIIGIATLVPGVSGGTMAILLGVYQDMIDGIANLKQDFKHHVIVLGELGIGAVTAILLFSSLMLSLLDKFQLPMQFLFIGIIIGGIPTLIKKAGSPTKRPLSSIAAVLIGLFIMILMNLTPSSLFEVGTSITIQSFILLFIGGILIALALVLPGISASFMLLILGVYESTLLAIKTFDLTFLLPIGLGVIIGTFASAKLIDYFLKKYPRISYLFILGFVLGSLVTLVPPITINASLLYAAMTMVLGFIFTYSLGKRSLFD